MKIKCINKGSFSNIEIGKIYTVLKETETRFIIQPKDLYCSYLKDLFDIIPDNDPEVISIMEDLYNES